MTPAAKENSYKNKDEKEDNILVQTLEHTYILQYVCLKKRLK